MYIVCRLWWNSERWNFHQRHKRDYRFVRTRCISFFFIRILLALFTRCQQLNNPYILRRCNPDMQSPAPSIRAGGEDIGEGGLRHQRHDQDYTNIIIPKTFTDRTRITSCTIKTILCAILFVQSPARHELQRLPNKPTTATITEPATNKCVT